MTKEEYIEHELRIRMLEHLTKSTNNKLNALIMLENLAKSTNNKLNALITIAITGFAMPMLLKYFGI